MLACSLVRPRTATTSLRDGSTVSAPPTRPEEPKSTRVGAFHQPANEASLGPPSSRGTLHPHAALRQRVKYLGLAAMRPATDRPLRRGPGRSTGIGHFQSGS